MVHRALQLAFTNPPEQRTEAVFAAAAEAAIAEFRAHPDVTLLGLDADRLTDLEESCRILVRRYLTMEDPTTIRPIGLELMLSARVGNLTLRGIIDRLELRDGELVVSDYKTGRPPSINWEGRSLDGVHFYAMLCERVLGRLPVAIRLLYLSTGETLETKPSDRSARFVATRTEAVWKAVERACATGDFQPRPSALCNSCAFQRWCPAWGGDADRAHLEAPAVLGLVAA
jgi:putative RecB family exonuclease